MTWSIILVVIVGVGVLLVFLVIALKEKNNRAGFDRNDEDGGFSLEELQNSLRRESKMQSEEKNETKVNFIKRRHLNKKTIFIVFIAGLLGGVLLIFFLDNRKKTINHKKEQAVVLENKGKEKEDFSGEEKIDDKKLEIDALNAIESEKKKLKWSFGKGKSGQLKPVG